MNKHTNTDEPADNSISSTTMNAASEIHVICSTNIVNDTHTSNAIDRHTITTFTHAEVF